MMLERIEKLLRTRAPGEGNYAGHLPDLRLNSTPVRSAVRARGGIPTGWAAAVLAIGLVCIAGAAVFGPLRNGAQGNDSSPSVTQSITSSTPSAILGQPAVVASFGTDNLTAAVLGPDGAAYVLDDTNHTVYRVTLEPGPVAGERVPVYSLGQASADGAGTTGSPKLITTAGGDVLILDKANSLWRWHPASGSNDGRGTLLKVNIPDSATWGSDVPAIAARVIDFNLGTYEIWVAVPGQQQIFRYSPADDGSGYPTSGRFSYLRNAPNVAGVTDMFVTHDQSVFLADDGKISHYSYSTGEADSWAPPGGSALGYTPSYSRFVANVTSSGQVDLYAFDESRHTVVAFSASATTPVPSQWQMPSDSGLFQALTSMFVVGTGDAPTLYWTENGSLIKAAFPAVTNGPATPAPSTSGLPSTKPTVGGFTPTGPMTATRNRATATLLEDGRVLITGGDPPDVGSGPGTGSAEIYDPATGTFTATGRMTAAREGHTATRLSDGRVLIVGGCPYVAAEIYDPATGKFSATGSLSVPRYAPTAALLPDGRVLIVGGATAQPDNSFGEVYDPATGRFTETGALPRSFDASTLTVLRDGRVLLAGGWGDNVNGQLPLAELFDPATNQFTPTGSMTVGRVLHTATLLPNGQVLITGGDPDPGTRAELYDPTTGTFRVTGSMTARRSQHTATLLASGQVLIAGGQANAPAELYDPATGKFSSTGSMTISRAMHTATLLGDGRVLIAGGSGDNSAEIYTPASTTSAGAAAPTAGATFSTYTVKPGDEMWAIAVRFGIQLSDLIAANPQIADPSHLEPGWIINIPPIGWHAPSPPSAT